MTKKIIRVDFATQEIKQLEVADTETIDTVETLLLGHPRDESTGLGDTTIRLGLECYDDGDEVTYFGSVEAINELIGILTW